MNYSMKATSTAKNNASIQIKNTEINFGTTKDSADTLANPAELFLSSFSACILKNVERFSDLMHFEYNTAEITVNAIRLEKPPRMDQINYELIVYSQDETLNINLLKKNIEKFGTIYNTVSQCCTIVGDVKKIVD
ncbi:OsmC family protein [Psychroserpens sp. NJDZ02]|uniref:OsmC family protein n=1 Tax=Psychroserpens sp. NJDZ02 TaxID=2570561 RepID=UPI0010A7A631|nr:OsmC family protein [Psychroserpens sp. NJDZ02]QCE40083.1 OsmC family protein [Psychroserpens sp. NJDZ02]